MQIGIFSRSILICEILRQSVGGVLGGVRSAMRGRIMNVETSYYGVSKKEALLCSFLDIRT